MPDDRRQPREAEADRSAHHLRRRDLGDPAGVAALRPRPRRPALRGLERARAEARAAPAARARAGRGARRRDRLADRAAAPASASARPGGTVPRGSPSSSIRRDHRHLPRVVRPRHLRPRRRDRARVGDLRPRRRRRRRQPAAQDAALQPRRAGRVPEGGARRARQRRGRRLLRARRRVRPPLAGEGDREGAAGDLRLRVGVPDEPAQPPSRARDRDRLRDGEPAGELRLVERREGDRSVRRKGGRTRPRHRRAPAGGEISRTAGPALRRIHGSRLRRWTFSY